jgi:hypothetical protein
VAKLHYTHEAMIDEIIRNPAISNDDLAEMFGYTPSWISTVQCGELFQSKLAARREEIVDPELRQSVKVQFAGLLSRSMEILRHKLNARPEAVPDQLALQVAKMSGQALGYGNKEQRVSVSETHIHLAELGGNLVDLLRQRKAEANGRTFDGIPEQRSDTPLLQHDGANGQQGHDLQAADYAPRSEAEPARQVDEPKLRGQASG